MTRAFSATGFDTMHHAHDRIARRIHRRPNLRADSGQYRRAVRGAFFGFDDFDVVTIDIRLNLAPKRRPRAAAAEPDLFTGTFISPKIVNVSFRL